MNIKKCLLVCILIFIVIFILAYIFIPVHLIHFSASDVAQIHIRDGNGGNEINIDDRTEIEYIVSGLDNIYEKTGDFQLGMGSSFYVDFILKNGSTKSLLLQNSENVIKGRIYYKPTEKNISKIYDHINDLVKNDGSQHEI